MLVSALIDGGFAAIAGLGFAFACNPPLRTLFLSALLAAIAHGGRFYLLQFGAKLLEYELLGLLVRESNTIRAK